MSDYIARIRGSFFIVWCRIFKKNVQIGPGLRLYKKMAIRGDGIVTIGKNCIIRGIAGDDSQYVCIDTYSAGSRIAIGDGVRLNAARIFAKFSVSIGSDCIIEESGVADTDFHSIDRGREEPTDETIEKCSIEIGRSVAIGSRCFISKGVKLGDGVTVWPGSIVASSVKAEQTVLGNPARPVKL